MMVAMIRTQVYLTEEQRRQIQRLAEDQHKTMAQVIREAIEEYIVQAMEMEPSSEALGSSVDPLWEIIELGSSGISDGSVHHDRDIYDED